jgi:hypothetical protein
MRPRYDEALGFTVSDPTIEQNMVVHPTSQPIMMALFCAPMTDAGKATIKTNSLFVIFLNLFNQV